MDHDKVKLLFREFAKQYKDKESFKKLMDYTKIVVTLYESNPDITYQLFTKKDQEIIKFENEENNDDKDVIELDGNEE
ncbi:unnamed protein product [Brachionus calyciflorus]|uniref:Uncharacterized protein n=1 Tax=Brachionus calyciflorus TaxID=104777 RepID=A0A813RK96_9BILA|nr:unnamed protein product [Brachionus calyciflorus]